MPPTLNPNQATSTALLTTHYLLLTTYHSPRTAYHVHVLLLTNQVRSMVPRNSTRHAGGQRLTLPGL